MKFTALTRLALFMLVTVFVYQLTGASRSNSTDLQDHSRKSEVNTDKPGPENGYKFSDPTPAGDWLAQPDVDVAQTNDPKNPVVITGIGAYVGEGNWRKQLMIDTLTLKNRSPKVAKAIRFGWIVITAEDVKAKRNRDAALAQGHTELITEEIAPNQLGS